MEIGVLIGLLFCAILATACLSSICVDVRRIADDTEAMSYDIERIKHYTHMIYEYGRQTEDKSDDDKDDV